MAEEQTSLSILFADVSDSTRLYESLGDAAAFREVNEYLSVFKNVVDEAGGRVVKTVGDGALCAFPNADSAVFAACEMHARVQQKQSMQERKISIRIGLHYGPVLVANDDVFGDTVNVAARMAQLAVSGQIITTGETVTLLSAQHRNSTRRLDALPVKGKHEAINVFEVLWQKGTDHTQEPQLEGDLQPRAAIARLRLMHGGREIIVVRSISMGRHARHGVALTDPMASRNHAFIERRYDRFVLIDQSSNATYVIMQSGEEYKLKREEMILHGSGRIGFGHRPTGSVMDLVGFICESGSAAAAVM